MKRESNCLHLTFPHLITWFEKASWCFLSLSGDQRQGRKKWRCAAFSSGLNNINQTASLTYAFFTPKHLKKHWLTTVIYHNFYVAHTTLLNACMWVCAFRCRAPELWGYESLWSGSMAPLVTHSATPRRWDANTATVPMGNTIATGLTVQCKNSSAEFLRSWYSLHHTLRIIRLPRATPFVMNWSLWMWNTLQVPPVQQCSNTCVL